MYTKSMGFMAIVGVRVLASLAGHKSIATTQLYIDINDDMKRKAVEMV